MTRIAIRKAVKLWFVRRWIKYLPLEELTRIHDIRRLHAESLRVIGEIWSEK